MEEVTSGEVEERGGLCAESVCDDQVPAVGQQTEVGGESDSNGEGDDVVSSLTGFSNPESCTGRSRSETSPEQISGGASQRTTKHDSNIRPDSVQQEEAVTTSSESCSSVVPHEACSGTGSSEALKLERVCNLVNYDSSDSDDSSIKTPTIENLEEEDGQVFQYPDSNSKTMEYGEQTDTGEVSAGSGVRASNEQTIGTAEQTEGGYQDGGYWNENGCWVDSQGQVWQPPEGYWQQDWTQGTEGEEGTWQDYGVDHGRGCDSQTQSQKAQAGQENEWVTQGEANLKQPDGVEEVAAHQPQGHFSNQEQSAGHCSTSTNSERLHYDQSAYQDGSSRQQSAHSGANTQSSNDAQNSNPQDCGSNDDTTYVQRHNYTSSDPNVTPSYDPRVQQHAHAYPAQHTYGHQDHYYQQGGENQQQRQQQYTGPVQYNQQEQYHSYSQEYHDQHQSYTQNSTGWSSYQYPGQQSHGSGWNDENSSWYQQQPAGAASHGHDTQSYNRHHGFEQGYHTPSDYERPLSLQFAPGGPPHGQPPPAPYGIPHPPPSHPPPHAHHYSPHSAPPPSHLPVPTPPPPHLSTPPPPPPPPQHHLSTPPHPPHLPTPPPYSSLSDPPLPPLLPPRPPPQSISHSSYSPSPQTHGVDEHYSRSTPPWPSRQHHSNHSNNSRRKWKYYRRESSHSRSSHYSSGVPSSPANSVSSDVSSTSRDSPVPVQHSPVAGSPDDSESHRPVSKTVFSNQLRDPRRCSPPVSVREKSPSMKGARYNSSPSNLTNKKSSSRKESSGSSPSSTRSTKETEQKKVEKPDVKDSKQTNTKKQSAKEPASFPKSSLTGFRIPKHSEKGKSQSDNPSTPARLTAPTTKVNNKEEKPKTNADISQAKSGVGTTSGSAAETVGSQPLAAPEGAKVDSEAKEPAKESITTPQISTENSLPPGLTPQQDLVSLFKSIDSTTLSALASTIQLALNSNSGKKMKLSTSSEEKVPSPLTTTKVETVECKDELKQPTLPANPEVEVYMKCYT
ncbi:hypothetical protein GBAR_LOCUS11911 [Geodia barretti]|uniref:Uncharacterized protein n=1 Tax=Geodia barretti TaxID=519541 RepID=A0AA35RZ27_GEOBA|nr:hypothetical protein GBAR_LOCUS11911 [Geodia barretti]